MRYNTRTTLSQGEAVETCKQPKVALMSLDTKDQDTGPQPFIRQEPKRRTVEHDEDETESRPAGGGGLGCALVGLVIVAVAILIGAALFLPPFSVGDRFFGTPFAPLNA